MGIPSDVFDITDSPVTDGICLNTLTDEVCIFYNGHKQKVQTFGIPSSIPIECAISYFYGILFLFTKHSQFNHLSQILDQEEHFINAQKLKIIFQNNPAIYDNDYRFDDELNKKINFEGLSLKKNGNKWKISTLERGEEHSIIFFDKEVDACIYMCGCLVRTW